MATKKVLKARGENRREEMIYYGELVLDGVKITGKRGNLNTTTDTGTIHERIGERCTSREAALERFAKLEESWMRNFKDKSRTEEEVPAGDDSLARAASNPALETEVLGAREASAAHATSSVYADWLQQQGDVRGELASLFLHGQEDDARRWIADNPTRLFGELDVYLDNEIYDLVWQHGFLRGASLKRASIDSNTDLAELTRKFLALPVARLVTELRFGLNGYESDNDWSETLAAVAESPQAAQMRVLRFDDYTYEDSEISWTAFGDFSPHWHAFPNLEDLRIRSGEGGTLGELDMPNLKTFVRVSGGLGEDEIQAIFSAKWPKLEHLEVWFGSSNYGAAGKLEHLAPLFGDWAPKTLRHLGIVNCEFVGEVLEPLAKSRVLAQLKTLDLSSGTLADEECDPLIQHAAAFKHLDRLDVSKNHLNERIDELSAAIPGLLAGGQRFDEADGDDRYAALGE